MKAIVHIGTEKTGSTSAQDLLFNNRETLSSLGYHFLQCAGVRNNRALPSYCLRLDRQDDYLVEKKILDGPARRRFQEDFHARFNEEVSGLPEEIHTVLISSEHFHSLLTHREELITLRTLLQRHFSEIEIIVYIRNQVEAIESRYSTAIKAGSTRDLQDYLRASSAQNHLHNYFSSLAKWGEHFGAEQLSVGIFSPEVFVGGSFIDDFLSRIDGQLPGKLSVGRAVSNESLSYPGQLVCKAINQSFPRHSEIESTARLWRRLINILRDKFTGKGERIPEEQRRKLIAMYSESNEQVRVKYFPKRAQLFPDAGSPDFERTVGPEFQAGLAEVFAEITRGNCLVPQRYINVFRDAAMLLEEEHPEEAFELMELAHQLRPSGTLIERKYLEYKARLGR